MNNTSNPNNCKSCKYYKLGENDPNGHCYMFEHEPTEVCTQYTSIVEIQKAAGVAKLDKARQFVQQFKKESER